MADYHAIGAVSETLRMLLKQSCPAVDFPAAETSFEILRIDQCRENIPPIAKGITLLLYRVAVSQVQRNLIRQFEPDGPHLPPLPLDLHYLISAWWDNSTRKQQELLAWCMRTLEDITTLNSSTLNYFGGSGLLTKPFDDHETLEIVYNPLSITDMQSLLDLLKPQIQLSVSYVVRVVMIDSPIEAAEAADVQTRVFEMAKGSAS